MISNKIPKKILNAMKIAGTKVYRLPNESLYSITNIDFGNDAWNVYAEWSDNLKTDTIVGAVCAPSLDIINSAAAPSLASYGPIQNEVNSIISYYSRLTINVFENGELPIIDPVLQAPDATYNIRNASVALSKLLERIQNAPASHQTIHAIRPGCYICTIIQTWANAVVHVRLFKS